MKKNEKYEVVNLQYYNPRDSLFKAKRDDREFVKYFYCSNKNNCELYKNGSCMMKCGLFSSFCPYGKVSTVEGFTKTARKCGDLIQKAKSKYPDAVYALKEPKRIGFVGEYVYLGLPFIYECRNPFRPKNSDFWCEAKLINSKYFIPEIIVELIKYKPYPWFGDSPIEDYQTKHIPELCFQLKKYMPEMYESVKNIYPEIEKLADVSFVGKKAKLKTLLPGYVILNGDTFEWDGDKLCFVKAKYNPPYKINGTLYIEPVDEVVEICDDNTVDENTEFVD